MKYALTALAIAACAALATPALATQSDAAKAAYDAAIAQHQAAQSRYDTAQAEWVSGQQAHLAWNAARKNWNTTDSGLQYHLVGKANPEGAQPTETDTVMREGETYEFLIPADLAYGPRRMGDDIPANSALYFTVELLKVNP